MRRLAPLLPLILAACGTEAPGHLVVDRSAVDWGTAARGDKAAVTLQLANDGKGPLKLELDPPEAPFRIDGKAPTRLAPGASATVQLIFAPQEAGTYHSTLALHAEGGSLEIPLEGTAVPWAISCDPIDFGNVVQGAGALREARCTAAVDTTFEATPGAPLGSGAAAFSTERVARRFAPGEETRIPVSFSAGAPGAVHAQLQLLAGSGRTLGELTLDGTSIAEALTLEPNPSCATGGLFLGAAAPGHPLEKRIVVRNRSTSPVAFDGVEFVDSGFAVEPGGSLELGPEESVELAVRFTPPAVGSYEAWMRLSTGQRLCFRAIGSGPALSCGPSSLDLGAARPGESRSGTIRCTVEPRLYEEGSFPLTSVESDDPSVAVVPPEGSSFPTGATFELPVTWTANAAGVLNAHVLLRSEDPRTPLLSLPVQGRAIATDCPLPGTLAFGGVEVEERKQLHLDFSNPGTASCYLAPLRFDAASDGFAATSPLPTTGIALSPGDHRAFEIAFTPRHGGLHTGSVIVEGTGTISLRGNGGGSCLVVAPAAADLGSVAPGCGSLPVSLRVYNWCAAPITVQRIDTGIRAPAGVVSATTSSQLPLTLAYQNSFTLDLSFRQQKAGTFYESVSLWEQGNSVATIVEVNGRAIDWGLDVDEFLWTATSSRQRFYVVRDMDGDGAIDEPDELWVARNGVRVPSSEGTQINWRYDMATGVLGFEALAPEPGDVIRVSYRAPCTR